MKVRLSSYGYTFVAKAVETLDVARLQHENKVYDQLLPIQGKHVPVCLGRVDLDLPLYNDSGIYKHVLFLSWAGMPLFDIANEAAKADIDAVAQAYKTMHNLGVLHRDAELRNVLRDTVSGSIMVVDFERAEISCRPPLGLLSSNGQNKKRKRAALEKPGMLENQGKDGFAQELKSIGELLAQDDGLFFRTCGPCWNNNSTSSWANYACSCEISAGEGRHTANGIDLNDLLGNDDGVLIPRPHHCILDTSFGSMRAVRSRYDDIESYLVVVDATRSTLIHPSKNEAYADGNKLDDIRALDHVDEAQDKGMHTPLTYLDEKRLSRQLSIVFVPSKDRQTTRVILTFPEPQIRAVDHTYVKSSSAGGSRKLRNDTAHGLNAHLYGSTLDIDNCQYSDDFFLDTATVLLKTEAFFNCALEFVSEFVNLVKSKLPFATPKDLCVVDDLRMELSTNQIQSLRAFTNDLLHLCPHLGEPVKNIQPLLIWSSTQPCSFQSLCDWSVSEAGHIALIQLQGDALQSQTWSQLVCNFVALLALLDLRPWSQNDNSPISDSALEDFDNFLRGDNVPNARVVLQKPLYALRRNMAARARDSQGDNAMVAKRLTAVINGVYLSAHQPPRTDRYLDEYHNHRLDNMPNEPNKSHAEALQLMLHTLSLEPGIHEQE
ncbi:putative conserved hypothetical protein [Colletotrichum sublineola]|uniref:Protein kinase domain-containing protein n=1 Tax=Colletotrichum sublineola TaxID=1173701 RepID=A0A066X9C9_COLSU|nr:putative conserved hypothetical protein [Colletotrichum sublineola]